MSTAIERQSQRIGKPPQLHRLHWAIGGRLGRIAADNATALLVGATTIGATLLFWLVHQSFVDDAYITLTYARTLAEHGDWGMLPGHESNSATSPLNVLLLGGLSAIVGDPVLALGVLYVLTCVALVLGLRGLGGALDLGNRVAVLGTPLLVASPLLASAIGLETMLVVTGFVYLAWACVRGDAIMTGLVAGILLWLRLDTAVIVAILVLATPALWRWLRLSVPLAVAVVAPWLIFSWVVLDSAIPDTLVIKQADSWGNFATGLIKRYQDPYTWVVAGMLILGGAGVLSALTWAWWRRRGRGDSPVVPALAVAGAAHFGVMWMLDVPPFFWYYAPTLATLTLAATIGLATLSTPDFGRVFRGLAVATGAGLLVLTAIPWWNGASTQAPLREMPIHGNWALPGEYEEIGRELGAIVGDTPVRGPGEVGALAYFCECTIVDRFSNRALLSDEIDDARDGNPLFELNYLGLDTGQLEPVTPGFWLQWKPGPDPSDRGWDSTGISGGYRADGHFELLTEPPDRSGPERRGAPRDHSTMTPSNDGRGR